MSIDELCYKVIGSAMAVHRHFGTGYLEEVYKKHKHKYRIYRSLNLNSSVGLPADAAFAA